jgi:hypothetical protein
MTQVRLAAAYCSFMGHLLQLRIAPLASIPTLALFVAEVSLGAGNGSSQ